MFSTFTYHSYKRSVCEIDLLIEAEAQTSVYTLKSEEVNPSAVD